MLTIDGSGLDKHGRILWLALSMSSLSRIPFRMERIRISQNPPGLLPEHLPFIHAFEVLMNAEVKGARLQSTELVFEPHSLRRGHLEIALGKGHPIAPFVLATMPVLLRTLAPLSLSITGATHHPSFPCIESVAGSFIPLLLQAGARIECEVAELGFAPHGE
ncbi:MAG: RNA 3'-terminal phosphate cyclase, partial [Sandaracinaceae bacterium]|nr:RNA 3'-terminal phosphate cyclase [Sandaracinaceae bacterium]